MLDFDVEVKGMNSVIGLFDGLAKKMPEIQHFAMINAGERARDAEQGAIIGTFDSPTRPIIDAPRLVAEDGSRVGRRSIGKNLKLDLKDVITDKSGDSVPERVLRPHIEGGPRLAKPSEKRLRRAGILKANEFIVPSRTAPLDRNGNIRGGEMTRILSDLRTFNESGYNANRNLKKVGKDKYFVAAPRGTRGIYKSVGRGGQGIKLVFLIVKGAPRYKQRFDFYGIGIKEFTRTIDAEFNKVYQRYLKKLK